MEYKYELHCHTKNVSRCGKLDVKELIDLYKEAGYSGLVLTDHYSPMTFDFSDLFSKKKITEHYLRAYKEAIEYVKNDDFTVLFGIELRFHCTVNDYLIFGIEPKMLENMPVLMNLYVRRSSKLLRKNGCLFIQAHPFRKFITRANPKYLDGVEVFNGKNSLEENRAALNWANENNLKIKTSGSDCHRKTGVGLGGIITTEKIKNNDDLLRTLKSGSYKLIENQQK